MADDLAAALGPMAARGGLASGRLLLELGAAPADDTLGIEAADRSRAPGWTSTGRALLEEGPAAAVDDAEELYAIGLPRGLPGGLVQVALAHRERLIAQVKNVRELSARRKSAASTTRGRRRPRSMSSIRVRCAPPLSGRMRTFVHPNVCLMMLPAVLHHAHTAPHAAGRADRVV